jgi:hypothetical protein
VHCAAHDAHVRTTKWPQIRMWRCNKTAAGWLRGMLRFGFAKPGLGALSELSLSELQ